MVCYTLLNTFNIMETNDKHYCQNTKDWINLLIQKSICFSGQSEKYRNQYLNTSLKLCDELVSYLQ